MLVCFYEHYQILEVDVVTVIGITAKPGRELQRAQVKLLLRDYILKVYYLIAYEAKINGWD